MPQRSGLALAVLALAVERPLHPYRMQQLIRERGKDQVINVGQRSQLYKTIDRLVRDGLIAPQATEREPARPERTVYAATEAGRRATIEWTVEMLSAPRRDFPEFTAALAYLPMISPQAALDALETRLASRRAELSRLRADLAPVAHLPRLVLIENEYVIAHLETDIAWIESLIDDLRSKKLGWNSEELLATARQSDSTADI
ncbi:PadR family transcriptional regulator [Pseudonocardia asaccharolytica]|uniref:PadR family transcriptional regulator n=1 Tax=Pseudonocardia asaccharolytica DSM 44247 = NBRC 16224 TaxID=1123024 RepID=A0A511D7R9_9PSEU|nr:PadR family transcriptional regulator [Pseudonocardia asaccharolytica]GEL20855.1 PadR family transcriptional regulator [Pseudonocardia asaccharolytica DSM 44247 = NBRC 16224]